MKTSRNLSGILTIGMIPGDGIGREVIPAAQKVLETVAPNKFKFEYLDAGFELFQRTKVALPDDTVKHLKERCDGALFGAVSSPSHKVAGYSSPIVALRKKLDLYANVRPVISHSTAKRPVDMLIIRENTECLYVKEETLEEHPDGSKTALATRRITSKASTRIAKMAFNMALQRNTLRTQARSFGKSVSWSENKLPKVTSVHKSNVLTNTDGLFRECVLDVSKGYEGKVDLEEQLVDSMVYRIFREPHLFDVAVAPNLYGDIISDAAAALVGSLGVVAGANVGDNFVIGEPVHGSAPDIAGKGLANPIAAIRSAGLLLEHLNMSKEATEIYAAVDEVLSVGMTLTPDLGGHSKTNQVVESIVKFMTVKN